MAFIGAYMKDGEELSEKGFLFGYNNLVWVVVANQVNNSYLSIIFVGKGQFWDINKVRTGEPNGQTKSWNFEVTARA